MSHVDNMQRRRALKNGALLAGATLAGGLHRASLAGAFSSSDLPSTVDYIVIGSGPGGAPVAANLAEAGYQVLVIEAGPEGGVKELHDTPAYWAAAGTDPSIRWDYFVRHYTQASLHGSQFLPEHDGVLYPRAAALGGCTANNALFTVYPDQGDWRFIQQMTGNADWSPDRMWTHWERFRQWQSIEQPVASVGPVDATLQALIRSAEAEQALFPLGPRKFTGNPNDRINVELRAQGQFVPPQSIRQAKRQGPRERLLDAAARTQGRLNISTDSHVEKILFERTPSGSVRAVGVNFLKSLHAYAASPLSSPLTEAQRASRRHTVTARKEVILSAGVFNSPQLLMLSGIGPADHLRQVGIDPLVNLPGVGRNLQDRVEAYVNLQYDQEFDANKDCLFGLQGDPCYDEYLQHGDRARFGNNGVGVWMKRRYSQGSLKSELVVFGLPVLFRGYVPGFDQIAISRPRNHWTWAVLKAHARGRAGYVRLSSNDPLRKPYVNKRSLEDGAGGEYDVNAVIEGIEVARRVSARAGGRYRELAPGPTTNLRDFIVKEQFGHHASCTNPIGADNDPMAVLDSELRVRGTTNLRVVDASSFPRIPGVFVWAPISIMAEKASVDILKASLSPRSAAPAAL